MGSFIWTLFCSENTNEKVRATKWENAFVAPVTDKGLDPACYKELLQVKKTKTDGTEQCARIFNRHFTKEGIVMNKTLEDRLKLQVKNGTLGASDTTVGSKQLTFTL